MKQLPLFVLLIVCSWLFALMSCNQPQSPIGISAEGQSVSSTESQLEEIRVGELDDVHRLGRIYLAGQPSAEDFAEFESEGVLTVINLRDPLEFTWDIEGTVEELGMEYIHVPIRGAEQLTTDVFDRLLALLNDDSRHPTLLFCATASRVGAVWYAHRVVNDGVSGEVAAEEATAMGLSSAALLDRAKEYVERSERPAATKGRTMSFRGSLSD